MLSGSELQRQIRGILDDNGVKLPDTNVPLTIKPLYSNDTIFYAGAEVLSDKELFVESPKRPEELQSHVIKPGVDVIRIYTNITAAHTFVPNVAAGVLQFEMARIERTSRLMVKLDRTVVWELPLNVLLSNDKANTGATMANVERRASGIQLAMPMVFKTNEQPKFVFDPASSVTMAADAAATTPPLPGYATADLANARAHWAHFQFFGYEVSPPRG